MKMDEVYAAFAKVVISWSIRFYLICSYQCFYCNNVFIAAHLTPVSRQTRYCCFVRIYRSDDSDKNQEQLCPDAVKIPRPLPAEIV